MKRLATLGMVALSLSAFQAQLAFAANKQSEIPAEDSPLYTPPRHSAGDHDSMHSMSPDSLSSALSSVYVKFGLGWAIPDTMNADMYNDKRAKSANFYTFSLGYGAHSQPGTMQGFRGELSYSPFRNFKYENTALTPDSGGDLSVHKQIQRFKVESTMATLYYDILQSNNFIPFVSAGLGVSKITTGDYEIYDPADGSYVGYKQGTPHHSLSWDLGVGVSYKMDEMFALEVAYKFSWLGKAKTMQDYYSVSIANYSLTGPHGAYQRVTANDEKYKHVAKSISEQFNTHALTAALRMSF